jgi:hypothetical protein
MRLAWFKVYLDLLILKIILTLTIDDLSSASHSSDWSPDGVILNETLRCLQLDGEVELGEILKTKTLWIEINRLGVDDLRILLHDGLL